ncbi:MAG: SDR family NAD(P)-dependent oxidoreductase [Clostridiales bacterium]|nr:SDR family NAD(P)-dependent oxidoreductase [Clostridiales bacterium]
MSYTFISGATGGIGKAFCFECAKNGDSLFLTGRNEQKLTQLKNSLLEKYGCDVEFFACDLTDQNSREKMLEYIDGKQINFNRIINVAGVDTQKAFMEYTKEKVLFQLRVNGEATVCLTHALLSRRENETEIITISSMSGQSPMPYFALYSATKAMLTNFFTSLHYELKKEGVKVTVVLPGGVPTRQDIVEEIKSQGLWGKLSAKSPEFVAKKSLKAVKKNKVKYIPGAFNKFLNAIMKIAPKKIVLSFIARRWKKHSKDAF